MSGLPTDEQKRLTWFKRTAGDVANINPAAADFAGASRPFMEQAFEAGMSRKGLIAAILTSFTTGEPPVLVPGTPDGDFRGWQARTAVDLAKLVPKGLRKRARAFAFNRSSNMRADFETRRDRGEILAQLNLEFEAHTKRQEEAKAENAEKWNQALERERARKATKDAQTAKKPALVQKHPKKMLDPSQCLYL